MNMMMASCAVGRDCSPLEFGEKMRFAGFDVIVATPTTAVAAQDNVFKFLEFLVLVTAEVHRRGRQNVIMNELPDGLWPHGVQEPYSSMVMDLVMEKAVYKAGSRTFIFVNKAKVTHSRYTGWGCPAVADPTALHFGSLLSTGVVSTPTITCCCFW